MKAMPIPRGVAALALFVVMLLTVLVGEGLRDAFDPRQKSKLE